MSINWELVLGFAALLAGPLGYLFSQWMNSRRESVQELGKQLAKVEGQNGSDHRDFEKRITALEVRIEEVLPELRRQIEALQRLVAEHIKKMEEYHLEIAEHIARGDS